MDNRNFAFGKTNYRLMAASVLTVILGFVLMSGGQSTENLYDPSIFNALRTKVAPAVCLVGFVSMIVAILYPTKKGE